MMRIDYMMGRDVLKYNAYKALFVTTQKRENDGDIIERDPCRKPVAKRSSLRAPQREHVKSGEGFHPRYYRVVVELTPIFYDGFK